MTAAPIQEFLDLSLGRLDLLLHGEILRLRARYALSLDEMRGLYVSDEQVDALVLSPATGHPPDTAELTSAAARLARRRVRLLPRVEPWRRAVERLDLDSVALDALVLALSPDLNLKYETLFGYLNNDVTRKWPTRDLALRLFASGGPRSMTGRRSLGALLRSGLLLTPGSERLAWLATPLMLAPAVSQYLSGAAPGDLGLRGIVCDTTPVSWTDVPLDATAIGQLRRLAEIARAAPHPVQLPLVVMEGRPGCGRREAAAALAAELGVPLLSLDLGAARAATVPLADAAATASALQRLQGAVLHVSTDDALFDAEHRPTVEAFTVADRLTDSRGPVILSVTPDQSWRELLRGRRFVTIAVPIPGVETRRQLWAAAVGATADFTEVANRFALTPGEIARAARGALDYAALRADRRPLDTDTCFEAARCQATGSLGSLATKVRSSYSWSDLVLPETTIRRIREIAGAMRTRATVFDDWGLGRRSGGAGGLRVLFSGPSGTGKTMTAAVIAGELGLDLFTVDLSGVVSKYIGETEKNLSRIFRAAQGSSAILFFDEADALFGKRSEVKDAHDRYANIEVAYLLQRLEVHSGIVILATNMSRSRNIDAAFSRRMHYVVEFPLPGPSDRERLWRGIFPSSAPVAADVDFAFLAQQFPIAGGDIRNVALEAAFLAAQNGRVVTMQQMVRAMARQIVKQGSTPSPADFREYYPLIAQDA